jgi:hypothetical protein
MNGSKLKRVMVNSLATSPYPEAMQNRFQQIRRRPGFVGKAGGLALHTLATQAPRLTARALNVNINPRHEEYVGCGMQSTVFRYSDSEVLKVINGTVFLNDRSKSRFAGKQERDHKRMAAALGEFVLPQEIFIAAHPIFEGRTAVQVLQPYKSIKDLYAYGNVPGQPATDRRSPALASQLHEFVARSRSLFSNDTLLPDTDGSCNLVVEQTGQLLMIDGQPITPDNARTQKRVLAQLCALDTTYALAA